MYRRRPLDPSGTKVFSASYFERPLDGSAHKVNDKASAAPNRQSYIRMGVIDRTLWRVDSCAHCVTPCVSERDVKPRELCLSSMIDMHLQSLWWLRNWNWFVKDVVQNDPSAEAPAIVSKTQWVALSRWRWDATGRYHGWDLTAPTRQGETSWVVLWDQRNVTCSATDCIKSTWPPDRHPAQIWTYFCWSD